MIKQLYERKSVRIFEEKNISKEDEDIIINSAIMAPTAGNQQMYTILKIKDEKLKIELSKKCDGQDFIKDAKLILIFLADFQKWYDIFNIAKADKRKPGLGDFMLSVDDALIAAQNSVVAAESLGIGSCYIGDIMENYEDIKEILSLPKYVFPACMLIYGYPTEAQKNRKKPQRVKKDLIVMNDRYKRYEKEELYRLVGKNEDEFERYVRAFCDRKYNSDFSKEMQRSVKKYIEDYLK